MNISQVIVIKGFFPPRLFLSKYQFEMVHVMKLPISQISWKLFWAVQDEFDKVYADCTWSSYMHYSLVGKLPNVPDSSAPKSIVSYTVSDDMQLGLKYSWLDSY